MNIKNNQRQKQEPRIHHNATAQRYRQLADGGSFVTPTEGWDVFPTVDLLDRSCDGVGTHRFVGKSDTKRESIWAKALLGTHLIRDERDQTHHVNYCRYKPVKHGYVQ